MLTENLSSQSNNCESKIIKPTGPVKHSLSFNSLTTNNSKKNLLVSTRDESDIINNAYTVHNTSTLLCSTGVVNRQKRKISNNESTNQIDQQQVNSLMYSFVTFEGNNYDIYYLSK